MNKQNLSKETIINKTIEMIEEKESLQNINMRNIAKQLKCAHTNIYNYFSNYNDLQWNTLAKAIEIMNEKVFIEEDLAKIIDSYIQFSIDHKGLYRLIWYERIDGEMPEEIKKLLLEPRKKTYENLHKKYENWEKVSIKIQVSLSYVHGEITIMINNRDLSENIDMIKWKNRVKNNALNIFKNYKMESEQL